MKKSLIGSGLGHYLLLMSGIVPVLALVLGVLYTHENLTLGSGHAEVHAALRGRIARTGTGGRAPP